MAGPPSVAFRAPTGTHDVLPPESARWARLVATFASQCGRAGYGLVVSPMFEDVAVFERVGESTDVVRKEMYDFRDKGDRHIALRPEGTASVVRAFVEHHPTPPWKTWYVGPNFRYERPQAGRYRQHHQLGAEAIGSHDPAVDVEIIALLAGLYETIGLRRVRLLLNTLGDPACRPGYLSALTSYLESRLGELSAQSRATLAVNPLRVLDSKREEDAAVIAGAPHMGDMLCDDCRAHFDRVKAGLGRVGLSFELAPRLVRGLDYYTRTTFEFAADALESAQNAVGGGGRYDGLVEQMGGSPTPGIGFGAGIERILLACDAEGVFGAPESSVDVFVVDTTGGDEALVLTDHLRRAGLSADRAFDGRSMKSQMKSADRSGAAVAVIVGSQEVEQGVVTVKDMRPNGVQSEVLRSGLVDHVRKLLSR